MEAKLPSWTETNPTGFANLWPPVPDYNWFKVLEALEARALRFCQKIFISGLILDVCNLKIFQAPGNCRASCKSIRRAPEPVRPARKVMRVPSGGAHSTPRRRRSPRGSRGGGRPERDNR